MNAMHYVSLTMEDTSPPVVLTKLLEFGMSEKEKYWEKALDIVIK